jgi:hypothetical protein
MHAVHLSSTAACTAQPASMLCWAAQSSSIGPVQLSGLASATQHGAAVPIAAQHQAQCSAVCPWLGRPAGRVAAADGAGAAAAASAMAG